MDDRRGRTSEYMDLDNASTAYLLGKQGVTKNRLAEFTGCGLEIGHAKVALSLTAHPEPHPEPHCHPTLTRTLASTLNTPPSPSRSPSPLALTLTLDPAPSPRALTLALALPKVELIGLPEEVDLARLCIQITLQQRPGSGAPAVVYSDLERREDVTVLDVPEKCVGFILGAKGATLRQARIRARVRARARARARVGMRTRETATGDCVHDQAQSVHSLHVHCICMCTVALRCARWR